MPCRSLTTSVSCSLALHLLVACASSGEPIDDAGDPTDDVDPIHDAGPDDDDPLDIVCPSPCASGLLPLAEGLRWEYEKTSGQSSPCGEAFDRTNGVHESTTEGVIVPLLSTCPEVGDNISWRHGADGHVYSRWQTGAWQLHLELPPVDGATWEIPFITYMWERADTMTVPAGSFSGCWRHVANDGQFVSTYCANVGLVREERSGGIVYELVGKNF